MSLEPPTPDEYYVQLPTHSFVITRNRAGDASVTIADVTRYMRAFRLTLLERATAANGLPADPRQLAVDLAELLRLEADSLECRAVALVSDM